MDLQTAAEIENIWQEIMKRTLNLSADARHITAANSGHSIHLTEDSIIYKLLREL